MMNNINLNLFKYFYEVAKYNSFTKAAEKMMISQPSLSYSVKTLENQLCKRLIIRNKSKIMLTDDGKKIYKKLKEVFDILDGIISDLDDITGKLSIGVRSAYASKILPDYINKFIKLYPNLKVVFRFGTSEYLLKQLLNKEIDVIIDEFFYEGNDLISYELKKYETIFFTTIHTYANIKNKIIDPDYLNNNEVNVVETNKITNDIKEKYPYIKFKDFQSTPLMINSMQLNQGIGISPKIVIDEDIKNNKLVQLKTSIILPPAPMFYTYIKRLKNKKIEEFYSFIKRCEDVS